MALNGDPHNFRASCDSITMDDDSCTVASCDNHLMVWHLDSKGEKTIVASQQEDANFGCCPFGKEEICSW